MKNALTFWEDGQLRRSGIFIVSRANKSLSPATFHVARGAAYSETFSDDVGPERSLGPLRGNVSINMSPRAGLSPAAWKGATLCNPTQTLATPCKGFSEKKIVYFPDSAPSASSMVDTFPAKEK
jgi:hypothetical protein